MDQYQIWANIAGVAGFIVSLFLAIFEWHTRRIKIKASNAMIVTKNEVGSLFIFQAFISNRSSLPIAITSAEMKYRKQKVANLMDGHITMKSSAPGSKRIAVTSILPLDIQPYSARDIIFQFPHGDIAQTLLNMAGASSQQKTSNIDALFLTFGTSRGRKRLRIKVRLKDLDTWFREYSDTLELRNS